MSAAVLVRAADRSAASEELHKRRRRRLEATLGVMVPVTLLSAWQLSVAVGWLDGRLFPAPLDTIRSGWDLALHGRLRSDVAASGKRVILGFALGALAGISMGLALGLSRLLRRALEPTLNALYVIPKVAILPIFLTIFGFGDAAKIALVGLTVFFYVWIQTMSAITNIPEGYLESGISFGASPWQMFKHVIVPAVLPQTFVALRLGLGVGILVTVASEFIVGKDGLGYLIFSSRQLFLNEWVYVGIATVSLAGLACTAALGYVGRRLTPWTAKGSDRNVADIVA